MPLDRDRIPVILTAQNRTGDIIAGVSLTIRASADTASTALTAYATDDDADTTALTYPVATDQDGRFVCWLAEQPDRRVVFAHYGTPLSEAQQVIVPIGNNGKPGRDGDNGTDATAEVIPTWNTDTTYEVGDIVQTGNTSIHVSAANANKFWECLIGNRRTTFDVMLSGQALWEEIDEPSNRPANWAKEHNDEQIPPDKLALAPNNTAALNSEIASRHSQDDASNALIIENQASIDALEQASHSTPAQLTDLERQVLRFFINAESTVHTDSSIIDRVIGYFWDVIKIVDNPKLGEPFLAEGFTNNSKLQSGNAAAAGREQIVGAGGNPFDNQFSPFLDNGTRNPALPLGTPAFKGQVIHTGAVLPAITAATKIFIALRLFLPPNTSWLGFNSDGIALFPQNIIGYRVGTTNEVIPFLRTGDDNEIHILSGSNLIQREVPTEFGGFGDTARKFRTFRDQVTRVDFVYPEHAQPATTITIAEFGATTGDRNAFATISLNIPDRESNVANDNYSDHTINGRTLSLRVKYFAANTNFGGADIITVELETALSNTNPVIYIVSVEGNVAVPTETERPYTTTQANLGSVGGKIGVVLKLETNTTGNTFISFATGGQVASGSSYTAPVDSGVRLTPAKIKNFAVGSPESEYFITSTSIWRLTDDVNDDMHPDEMQTLAQSYASDHPATIQTGVSIRRLNLPANSLAVNDVALPVSRPDRIIADYIVSTQDGTGIRIGQHKYLTQPTNVIVPADYANRKILRIIGVSSSGELRYLDIPTAELTFAFTDADTAADTIQVRVGGSVDILIEYNSVADGTLILRSVGSGGILDSPNYFVVKLTDG